MNEPTSKRIATIRDRWESYKRGVYPEGMTPEQEFQVIRAFMAGAKTTMLAMHGVSHLDVDDGLVVVRGFERELDDMIAGLIKDGLSRNRKNN